MTVAELIAKLQELPQDYEVTISYDGGYGGGDVEDVALATEGPYGPAPKRVVVLSDFKR